MHLREELLPKFKRVQARMHGLVRDQPGFCGRESISPTQELQDEWITIFRFDTNENLQAWLHFPPRADLIEELEKCLTEPVRYQVVADDDLAPEAATAVFSHRVRPGTETEFYKWKRRITKARSQFAGLLDSQMFPPVPGVQEEWIDIVRFDNSAHLNAWLHSEERKKLLEESSAFTEKIEAHQIATGLENWFSLKGQSGGDPATIPTWKQAALVLLALYPTSVFIRFVTAPMVEGWATHFQVLLANGAGVAVLAWLLMPRVSRIMNFWTHPSPLRPRWATEAAGFTIIILGLSSVVAVSWLLGKTLHWGQ